MPRSSRSSSRAAAPRPAPGVGTSSVPAERTPLPPPLVEGPPPPHPSQARGGALEGAGPCSGAERRRRPPPEGETGAVVVCLLGVEVLLDKTGDLVEHGLVVATDHDLRALLGA